MRVLPPVEEKIRREIRDARALDPLISVAELQRKLEEKLNRSFSHRYVSKLADKVALQALVEMDRTQIEDRMNFTRENYRIIRERLLKIVYWNPQDNSGDKRPWASEVIDAAKTIVMLDFTLLKAEIETGMYKKPIELLAKEIHYDPLPDDVRVVIIQSWKNFGMLPAAAIEEMVPAVDHANTGTIA